MAACAHTLADSASISPLTYTQSSAGGSFQDANKFSFRMDADVSPLMDWHRNATVAAAAGGSYSAESRSKDLESNTIHRRLQGLTIARPSNPSPPSLSSRSSSNLSPLKNSDRETSTSLSPLELIQQSRAYRHRPPHHIYVRHCDGPSSPLHDATHVGEGKNQRQPSPPRLPQELLVLIKHHRSLRTSLASIDEEATTQKLDMLRTLATASGDAKDVTFAAIVVELGKLREERRQHVNSLRKIESILQRWVGDDTSDLSPSIPNKYIASENLDGQWFTLTKPTYSDCLGFNDDGDPLYRLGRMSFEMFFPGDLICAIQAVFNPIMKVVPPSSKGPSSISVPKTLQEEVKRALANDSGAVLKTYHIVVAFTIEPYSPSFGSDSPNRIVSSPIRGIMTTYGYVLPDPTTPDRLSVWFSGGKVTCGEEKESHQFQVWKEIFGSPAINKGRRRRRRTFREGAMVFAAQMMMGATGYDDAMDEDTGEVSYTFTRPVGGHAKNYVDILHLDDKIRVMRGHAGTTYAFARLKE
mmetsp:Transcript_29161/g.49723  ORF Transcript_29161/g.49723 Transcript_29161/m.49723 type:complete len:526 (+) Transcript_29161:87-1664(+)